MVPSSFPVASSFPSGEYYTARTGFFWSKSGLLPM